MQERKPGSVLGGILLIAGTSIGGGMLGLPVLTGLGGLLPSFFIYTVCWLFMAATGLLFLEVCLWMGAETNIVSMAERTLGKWGKIAAWVLYLFLFYSLTTAYSAGCGAIVQDQLSEAIPRWVGALIFLVLVGPFLTLGARYVDWLNRFFVVGMFVTFFAFLALGWGKVNPQLWERVNFSLALLGLPVVFVSFGFQGTVPTLVHYLKQDAAKCRRVILVGSAIPLFAYLAWQSLILGILPESSIVDALTKGQDAVRPLKARLDQPNVFVLGQFFAFFALISSFLGVTLGLRDFLADGFHIKKTPFGRMALTFLTFGPPLLFTMLYPQIFLLALHFAGGLGCALLLGALPVVMVWRGRYHHKLLGNQMVFGGRTLLLGLLFFVLLELGCEAAHFFYYR